MEENPNQNEEIRPLLSEEEYYSKIPLGCKFDPSDAELVDHYLRKKIMNEPLPLHMIRDVDVYKYNPQQLTEMYPLRREQVWYFFTPREWKPPKEREKSRSAGNGSWKTAGPPSVLPSNDQQFGYSKKNLFFYERNARDYERTKWKMQEYKLDLETAANDNVKKDHCILCKISTTAPKEEMPIVQKPQPKQKMHRLSGECNTNSDMPGGEKGHDCVEPSDSVAGEEAQADPTRVVKFFDFFA